MASLGQLHKTPVGGLCLQQGRETLASCPSTWDSGRWNAPSWMIHSSVGQAESWPQTEHSGDARIQVLSHDGVESLQKMMEAIDILIWWGIAWLAMGLTDKSTERGMQCALLQGNIASQLRGSLKQDKKMKEKRQCLGLFPPLMKYSPAAGRPTQHLRPFKTGTGSEWVERWEKIEVYGYFLSGHNRANWQMMVLGCIDGRSGITNWVLSLLYLSRYRNG